MIELNGKPYGLVLLDTNVLSEFLLAPKEWGPLLVHKYFLKSIIPSYSAFSVVEITSRPEVFEKFIDIFSAFPAIMLDGYDSIFQKEMEHYSTGKLPSPVVISPAFVRAPGLDPREGTRKLFETAGLEQKARQWKSSAKSILDGMLGLRPNFPPKGSTYSLSEIARFVDVASRQQIELRAKGFFRDLKSRSEELDISRFPSILITSLIVFYKFYVDKRRPADSDVFDIIIGSVLPYVDAVITEAGMRSIISTIQRRHKLLNLAPATSLAEARDEIPMYKNLAEGANTPG